MADEAQMKAAHRAVYEGASILLGGKRGAENIYHCAKQVQRDSDDPAALELARLVLELIPDPYGQWWEGR